MMVQRRNPRSGPQQPQASVGVPKDWQRFSAPSHGGMTALPEWDAATALTRVPGIGAVGTERGALNQPKSQRSRVYRRQK